MSLPLASMTLVTQGPIDTRPVFIDALNLAYWCGTPPSLRIPIAAMIGLLSARVPAWMVFDASARYRLGPEAEIYEHLLRHPQQVIEVPSGQPADRHLLKMATRIGACVLSRDRYRDHRSRHRRLIDDPARLIAGEVREDRLTLPLLAMTVDLPATAQAAWSALEPLLRRNQVETRASG